MDPDSSTAATISFHVSNILTQLVKSKHNSR